MTRRMLMALLSLVGVFIALYLMLYKIGKIGTLACGTGGCEVVQMSKWATFMGAPVATWGVAYYVLVFSLTVAALQERFAIARGLSLALAIVTGWGLVFSLWLTYLELFVIHAICRWCVTSASLAAVLFFLAWGDWKATAARMNAPLVDPID